MVASIDSSAFKDVDSQLEPIFELCFRVMGKYAPADHGYALMAASVHVIPQIHHNKNLSILTISGIPDKKGKIILTEQSRLRIRIPITQIPLIYKLAGKSIRLGIHEIQIGIPEIFMLKPSTKLRSRIVVIKGYQEPQSFLSAAQRQLAELEISGEIYIPKNKQGEFCRKTIKVKHHTVVGFTTIVSGLNDEDSLKLQEQGIGGKRRMGCGYFVPCKR